MTQIDIETREEIFLTSSDDQEIAALLADAFGQHGDDGFEGRSYFKQRHHLRVLGRIEGRLVGHIALCFRAIHAAGEYIPIIGLAEVATAPDLGGKGIASRLLKHTIEVSHKTQADFILLFGDHPVYARNGFRSVSNTLRYTVVEGGRSEQVVTAPTTYLQIMPLTDKRWDDLAEVDLLGHLF